VNPARSSVFVGRMGLSAALSLAFACASLAAARPAYSFPWSIDMYREAAVQSFSQAPRVMPSDTLPAHGGEPPMSIDQAAIKMHNPLQPTPENLAHGKEIFTNTCAPCHGETGVGNGSVAFLLKDQPKNLVTGDSKDRPDGYIYGAIRDGVQLMPSYADAMSTSERWQVVLYVRSLQHPVAASAKGAPR